MELMALGRLVSRVLGLGCGGADQLDTDERERRDLEARDESHDARGEEAAVVPQVRETGLGAVGGLEVVEDHHQAHHDECHDRDDLDEREPELGFAECLHSGQVQRDQQYHGGQCGNPQGQAAPPVVHVAGDRDDVGDPGHDPAEPIGPAGEEPGPWSEQVGGEIGERLVMQVGQQQFAHRPHHEEQHEADDHVHEDHRGAGE